MDEPNLLRLRADRRAKLATALAAKDVSGAVLLGTTNARWATGARVVGAEPSRSARVRNVVVVANGDPIPHLFTHFADGVPSDHPADHVHPGIDLDDAVGASALASFLADRVGTSGRLLLDEWTMPLRHAWQSSLAGVAVDD